MDPTTLIEDFLQEAFKSLYGIELQEVGVEHPQNPQWGDYSSNVALVNAKNLGKPTTAIAKELVEEFSGLLSRQSIDTFEKVQVAGPGFINFSLSKRFYLSQMFKVLKEKDDFGKAYIGRGEKVALEHSNVNPNKAAHIGHLRNAVIGQFLERVYEFIGYDVNVQYYSNDLGVQVSTSLLGMKKLGNKFDPKKYKKFDHYAWDVYAKISQMLDEDGNLRDELRGLMSKLDARDPEISEEQKELSERVLKDNILSFSSLGIDYDLVVHESNIKDMSMWEKTFEKLKVNKNVYLSESGVSGGCWLVRMGDRKSSYNVEEDKIIVRSSGIPTYTGKDIAYHMWKFGLLNIDFLYQVLSLGTQEKPLYETSTEGGYNGAFTNCDIVIDVIDVRQTYAIDAVRKSLLYLGFKKQSDSLIHVNYGHVYLSAGTARSLGYDISDNVGQVAMSGRRGVGVKMDDFIDMVDRSLKSAYGDFPNKEDVRNSAIKFDMLRYDTFQDVIFDVDAALNLKGFTGPYLQYTHARASSLLEKAGFTFDTDNLDYLQTELGNLELEASVYNIMRVVYKFPEVVLESAKHYAPNTMCVYLYDLCQKFNAFYNDCPVLNAESPELKEFRLLLTTSVKQVIKNGLYLLGVNAVDKM